MWLQLCTHGYTQLRMTWAHGCAHLHCIALHGYTRLRTAGCHYVPEMGARVFMLKSTRPPGRFQANITMLVPHQAKHHTTNPLKYPPVYDDVREGCSNQPYRLQS